MLWRILLFLLLLCGSAQAALPTILLSNATAYQSVNKTDATAITVKVRLTEPCAQNVTATVTVTGCNTAAVGLGQDINLSASTITITAGSLSTTFTATVVNNPVVNLDRLATITLTNPSANARVTPYARKYVYLVDNARAGISDVPAPSGGDDTATIQTVIDTAHSAGDGYVIRFAAGTYLVQRSGPTHANPYDVLLYPGNTYLAPPGQTTIIKRFTSTPEDSDRLFSSDYSHNRANGNPLGIYNLTFDGAHQYTDEHSPCLMLGSTSSDGNKLICKVENVTTQDNPAGDGIWVYADCDINIYNCYSNFCHRGGLTFTGGNTTAVVKNVHINQGKFHIEVESDGYNSSRVLNLTADTVYNDTSDLDMVSLSNSFPWNDNQAGGATGTMVFTNCTWYGFLYISRAANDTASDTTYSGCYFYTLYGSAGWTSIQNPYKIQFVNSTIERPYCGVTDSSPSIVPIIYTKKTGVETGELLSFDTCILKTDGNFPADANVTALVLNTGTTTPYTPSSGDDYTNLNKIKLTNCTVGNSSTKDIANVIRYSSGTLRGGWFEAHGGTFNCTDGTGQYPIEAYGDDASGHFYLLLDGVTFNTNKFVAFSGNISGNAVKLNQSTVPITSGQNSISGSFSNITFDSDNTIMRAITGTSSPSGSASGFCNAGATKYDQFHDTVGAKYYKCTAMPNTWTEYTP